MPESTPRVCADTSRSHKCTGKDGYSPLYLQDTDALSLKRQLPDTERMTGDLLCRSLFSSACMLVMQHCTFIDPCRTAHVAVMQQYTYDGWAALHVHESVSNQQASQEAAPKPRFITHVLACKDTPCNNN